MNEPEDVDPAVQTIVTGKKRSGLAWLAAAFVFALMTAGFLWVRSELNTNQDQDLEQGKVITSLSRDSQRLRGELARRGVNPDTIAPAPEKRVDAAPGTPGAPGLAGVGIVRTARSGGQLQVFYSDGTSQVVGSIVGPGGKPGRGVASQRIRAGRLLVRYTDGTTQDLGPVIGAKGDKGDPGRTVQGNQGNTGDKGDQGNQGDQGPKGDTGLQGSTGADSIVPGATGAPGQPPLSWTVTDAEGRQSTCTRTEPFDPTLPAYTCQSTPQTTAQPSPT